MYGVVLKGQDVWCGIEGTGCMVWVLRGQDV